MSDIGDNLRQSDADFHQAVLDDEERLLALLRAEWQKQRPAVAAEAVTPTSRSAAEAARAETREMKPFLSASRALSDVEHRNESEWLVLAKRGRDEAQKRNAIKAVEALAATVDSDFRTSVWAAYLAGCETKGSLEPPRDLWAPFPVAIGEADGKLVPVLAEQWPGTPSDRVVKVQLGASEETRTLKGEKVHALKREVTEWRPYAGGVFGCTVRFGKPEKSVLLTYDVGSGAFGVRMAGELKPDPMHGARRDPTLALEQKAQQARALSKDDDKVALAKVLFEAESGFERATLLKAMSLAGDGKAAVSAAFTVAALLKALSFAQKTPRRAWLGINALLACMPAEALGPYELMWAHANPVFALELIAGGRDLAVATHAALEQSTSALRLLNRELSHRVARSVVRYVATTVDVGPIEATLSAHLQADWPEGVLVDLDGRDCVVIGAAEDDDGAVTLQTLRGPEALKPASLRAVIVRAQAVQEETDEARAKLEMNLRHALTTGEHKHGLRLGLVTPGQPTSSAGVFIEDAEQWIAEKVEVRGKDVRYSLRRGQQKWSASAAELTAGRDGKRLQWIEAAPKTKR